MNTSSSSHTPNLDGLRSSLQSRFGFRIAALLGERARATPPDISERLRVAREQAVLRGRSARRLEQAVAAPTSAVFGRRSGQATLGSGPRWWLKLASAMPLAILALGLIVIDRLHDEAQIAAVADVDAALLADDLPPAAYTDPGFVEYLKTHQ